VGREKHRQPASLLLHSIAAGLGVSWGQGSSRCAAGAPLPLWVWAPGEGPPSEHRLAAEGAVVSVK